MAIKKVRGNLCRNTATNLFQACDARRSGAKKRKTTKRRKKASMGSTKGQECTETKKVWSPFFGQYVERCAAFKPKRKKTSRKKGSKKSRKKSGKCKKWKKVYSPFFDKKVRRCADFA